MNLTSVRTRFVFSVVANALRAIVGFVTGLIVARSLSPVGYGDLAYLLGSFLAARALLDMGSSSAFYTFISQRARGKAFYLLYFAWLLIQFTVSVLLVAILLPQSLIDQVWLGHSREVILLAFVASFMQQQVWTTITQMGESSRQTVKVQLLGFAVIATHLIVVITLNIFQWLSVTTVLIAIIAEYVMSAIISSKLLFGAAQSATEATESSVKDILGEYWKFCRPLMLLALASFAYEFADRWLLQKFAGSSQQGFYQISAQLAAISLLATTSILNIFWKEISAANEKQNKQRVAYLYNKVSRGLFMLGAVLSCFLVPWAEQTITLLLGAAYQASWTIFAVMLLYPIHQSMGQVNGTMFLACTRTNAYMVIGIVGMVVSIPVSYFFLAPTTDLLAHGLALGALGLALKMVGMNVLLVNIQSWMIARFNGWKYEWKYQVVGIAAVFSLGHMSKTTICFLLPAACVPNEKLNLVLGLSLSGVLYLFCVAVFIWICPWVAGLERNEMRSLVVKYNPIPRLLRRL